MAASPAAVAEGGLQHLVQAAACFLQQIQQHSPQQQQQATVLFAQVYPVVLTNPSRAA
jgi:hypothetical protein